MEAAQSRGFASLRVFTHNARYLQLAIFDQLSSSNGQRACRQTDFFEGIGEAIGDAIRVVVEFLLGIFTNFFGGAPGMARSAN